MDERRYKVRVADNDYWRGQIKCQYACPVHTDARGYVRAIADGDYERAYLIARGPNPLASLCGRICGAPCEAACRRGSIDQPISIRALKRFVCEKLGSDSRHDPGRELFPCLKSKTATPGECFEFLAEPSVAEDLRDLGRYLGWDEDVPKFNWFPTYDSYEAAYISLFDVGFPEPVVPLFESAHDKTHSAQEIALENSYFYDVLGLKSDPTTGVSDYLITQLEFLAAVSFTRENASEDTTRLSLARAKSEFLGRHLLNWLPTAAQKLNKTEALGFPLLTDLLVQFLHRERSATAPLQVA